MRNQLEPLGIELQVLATQSGAELGVQELATLSRSAIVAIGQQALAPTTGVNRRLQPHSVAIIIGQFVTDTITPVAFTVDVDRDLATGQFPSPVTVALNNANPHILVPLDDGSQIVSATLSGGGGSRNIAATAVSGHTTFSRQLTVDISAVRGEFAGIPAVKLELQVKAIRDWAVGWAYTAQPVIYLNMRNPNTDTTLTAERAEALVIHELGHKLHLAASGEDGQPDQQPHHYPSFDTLGVQHQGPHCSVGVPAGTDLWTAAARTAATCTMWGALKGITAYCDECQTTLRKVDLHGGF